MNKIFVVDDEKLITDILERLLKKNGYEVAVANSLEGAKDRYSTEYDVVILDIELGDGDSFSLLGEIKRKKPETIVLMFSGHDDEEKIIKAKKLGADGFIPKPYKIEFLSDMLLKKLSRLNKNK